MLGSNLEIHVRLICCDTICKRKFIVHSRNDKYLSQLKGMTGGQKLIPVYYIVFYSTDTLLAEFFSNLRLLDMYQMCPCILAYEKVGPI